MHSFFSSLFASLSRGVRLSLLQRVDRFAPSPAPAVIVAMILLAVTIGVGAEAPAAGDRLYFSAYGLSYQLAQRAVWIGLLLLAGAAAASIVPASRVIADFAALAVVFGAATLLVYLDAWLIEHLAGSSALAMVVLAIGMVGLVVWFFFALWWTGRNLWQGILRLPGLRFVAVAMLAAVLVPYSATIVGTQSQAARFDVWHWGELAYDWLAPDDSEYAEADYRPSFDVEHVLGRQLELVERRLRELKPSPADRPTYYFVGAGSYAYQDVFKNEILGARAVFDEHFGTAGRSVVLVNSKDTADELPLANATNLAKVLRHVGSIMDPEKDVLVLVVTTHGAPGMLSVEFPGVSFNQLTTDRLSTMLAQAGIKYRVLIISACHSGSFVEPLEDQQTLIMTASAADRNSFGCADKREWTYFGDALFNRALRAKRSLPQAFADARDIISGWERDEWLTQSQPQISLGSGIEEKLDALTRHLAPSPSEASITGNRTASASALPDAPVPAKSAP